jgi:hypothetical protein
LRFDAGVFRRSLALAAFLGVWLGGGTVRAHIGLIEPDARTVEQKEGPCGTPGLPRGDTVAVYAPGDTITVMWDETIDHDSHYRIALDLDGDDDLVAPDGDDDLYNSPTVLIDGIYDDVGGRYVQEVILPDVECERCVLQLIQVMYGAGNYFQCADIAIRRGGGPPPVPLGDGGPEVVDAGPGPGGDPPPGAPVNEGDGGVAPMGTPPPEDPGLDPPTGNAYGGCAVSRPPLGAPAPLGATLLSVLGLALVFRCTARTPWPRSRRR